ncbi:hypothetical protein BH23PSE1_BH23PSE1_17720 [soil metagenome]
MNRKMLITVSAMILAASFGSPLMARPSIEQLSALASILEANDVAALRSYLEIHPDLAEGDTQLAILLRRFLSESGDFAEFIGFEPDLRDALIMAGSSETGTEEGYDPGDPDPAEPPREEGSDAGNGGNGEDGGQDGDSIY